MEVFLIRLLQFLLAISLLVLLHELGHFTFAKLFKVRVTKFYLFFNPKFHILSTYDTWVRRLLKLKPEVVPTKAPEAPLSSPEGDTIDPKEAPSGAAEKEYVGTEYGLGWLPLGGYCAIDGMIDETNQKLSADPKPWEFRTKPVWQRLLIMIGGVLVNFLLALFIYSMILFHWGETYVPVEKMTLGMKFNSEAKALGFQDGDILVSTDRGKLKKFDDDLFREVSKARTVNVIRQGQPVAINIPESTDLNLLNMFKSTPMFMRPFLPAVVDSVMPGTAAAQIGLQPGDSILAINGKAIDSHNEFTDEIARLGDVLATAKTPADSLRVRTVELVIGRWVESTLPDSLTASESSSSLLTSHSSLITPHSKPTPSRPSSLPSSPLASSPCQATSPPPSAMASLRASPPVSATAGTSSPAMSATCSTSSPARAPSRSEASEPLAASSPRHGTGIVSGR